MVITKQMIRDIIAFTGREGLTGAELEQLLKKRGIEHFNYRALVELIEEGVVDFNEENGRFYCFTRI